jgi:hypothetical protein
MDLKLDYISISVYLIVLLAVRAFAFALQPLVDTCAVENMVASLKLANGVGFVKGIETDAAAFLGQTLHEMFTHFGRPSQTLDLFVCHSCLSSLQQTL